MEFSIRSQACSDANIVFFVQILEEFLDVFFNAFTTVLNQANTLVPDGTSHEVSEHTFSTDHDAALFLSGHDRQRGVDRNHEH